MYEYNSFISLCRSKALNLFVVKNKKCVNEPPIHTCRFGHKHFEYH